jgi:hypothetical protein
MNPENLIIFISAGGGALLAGVSMIIASAFYFSRVLMSPWIALAIGLTFVQGGCWTIGSNIGRATGGYVQDPSPRFYWMAFITILVWTAVLCFLNRRFRRNPKTLPNSLS